MLNSPCPHGSTAELDGTHAKQPPAKKSRSDGRHKVDNSRGDLIGRSILKVTRDEVNTSAGTVLASDDKGIVFFELLGRPELEGRPAQGKNVQNKRSPNMGDRFRQQRCDRHEEEPAVETRRGDVLSA